jgi:hypothetical protein
MKEKLCVRLVKSSWFKKGLNFTNASYDMPACKVQKSGVSFIKKRVMQHLFSLANRRATYTSAASHS